MKKDSGSKQPETKGKKTFVLDTNVLIHDPDVLGTFDDNDVVIPIMVIEELDDLKLGVGEVPYSARKVLRNIGAFLKRGQISTGVPLPGGGTLRVETGEENYFPEVKADNMIISCALKLKKDGMENVIVISKDTAVRIKAEAKGMIAQDYRRDKTSLFQKYGKVLNDEDYGNGILSVRYQQKDGEVYRLWGKDNSCAIRTRREVFGIGPKNIEQSCAIDALTSPDIKVIALTGKAGAGKTLLALAASLHQTTKSDPLFDRVMVARPTIPMKGYDLGYLPGDVAEKIDPWMQPIYDNLEVLIKTPRENGFSKGSNTGKGQYASYQYLIDTRKLVIGVLTHMRGRSLPGTSLVIDEAQNLRPIDAKTLATRLGEGSKIVFCGDLDQIDTPYLDAESNGLAYLIARLINQPDFCYLHLDKSARSELADRMAELL